MPWVASCQQLLPAPVAPLCMCVCTAECACAQLSVPAPHLARFSSLNRSSSGCTVRALFSGSSASSSSSPFNSAVIQEELCARVQLLERVPTHVAVLAPCMGSDWPLHKRTAERPAPPTAPAIAMRSARRRTESTYASVRSEKASHSAYCEPWKATALRVCLTWMIRTWMIRMADQGTCYDCPARRARAGGRHAVPRGSTAASL